MKVASAQAISPSKVSPTKLDRSHDDNLTPFDANNATPIRARSPSQSVRRHNPDPEIPDDEDSDAVKMGPLNDSFQADLKLRHEQSAPSQKKYNFDFDSDEEKEFDPMISDQNEEKAEIEVKEIDINDLDEVDAMEEGSRNSTVNESFFSNLQDPSMKRQKTATFKSDEIEETKA